MDVFSAYETRWTKMDPGITVQVGCSKSFLWSLHLIHGILVFTHSTQTGNQTCSSSSPPPSVVAIRLHEKDYCGAGYNNHKPDKLEGLCQESYLD